MTGDEHFKAMKHPTRQQRELAAARGTRSALEQYMDRYDPGNYKLTEALDEMDYRIGRILGQGG